MYKCIKLWGSLFVKLNTLLVMVDYKNCKLSGPHYLCVNYGCQMILRSSQILSKLDLQR